MPLATCDVRDGVAWVRLDDGRVNAMSLEMQTDVHSALDIAEGEGLVTVLTGRDGVFSGGFDLNVLRGGDANEIAEMVLGGFGLARRLLSHPRPVVVACSGHAVAMGLFLLLSGDYLIGPNSGPKLVANEVSIGLTVPHSAEVILRHRLTPAAFERTALLSLPMDPIEALAAGALDEIVDPVEIRRAARDAAESFVALDPTAQQATKARVRSGVIEALDVAIAADRADFDRLGSAQPVPRSD
ncbi:MAG: crotonase/enoyl-CoA hydratase family protein [Microthrixaceae bacterium]